MAVQINEVARSAARETRRVVALAMVSPIAKAASEQLAAESKAHADPWAELGGLHGAITPPLDPLGLALLEESSSELGQCLTALEVNIPGFGWRIKPLKASEDAAEADEAFAARLEEEREFFHELLTYADYDEGSFTSLRRRARRDLESSGNAYWEVVRDAAGRLSAFRLIPHTSMRMTPKGSEVVEVERLRPTGKGLERRFKRVRVTRRFRRFVQAQRGSAASCRAVYFREYGDPRELDSRTGEFKPAGEIPREHLATEIVHFRIYSSRTPYGLPRYLGNLLALFGSRKSEEINFQTFTNNNVPSMVFLVSNGELTSESVERIKQFTETQIQGSDNYSKMLIVEALPFEDSGDQAKVEIKPLVREQHTDELFQNYDANNREKIRQSFRLPPIFVGRAGDYTRATAETSRALADEQVFHPEREEDDHLINRILTDEGMLHHTFATNTPNVTNDTNLIAVMTGAEKTGGMTPRIARKILEDVLNKDLPGFGDGFDPDVPFSLSMADAVKNKAQANEVGQQVTALKGEADDATWIDRIENALVVRADEGGASVGAGIALNAGSQAEDIADGIQRGYLSPIPLNLRGRDMFLGDGRALFARVRFGEVRQLTIENAAVASGVAVEDLRTLFPGRFELHFAEVVARDAIPVVSYEQPTDSLFAVVVGAG